MQLQTFHMEGVCGYIMNMNATAQMVTSTQVGCTRANWKKLYEESEKAGQELIRMHREAVDHCNTARDQLARTERMLDLAGAKNMGIDLPKIVDLEQEHGRIQANLALQVQEVTHKLIKARELLFAVQPFCAAWAAFDLADEIKDFLDGRPKRKELNGQEERQGPHNG